MPKRYGTTMQGKLRRQSEERATPKWANRRAVRSFWKLSKLLTKSTGVQWSVDHVVPLLHPLVCGLHVENNLRVMTLASNLRKSNNWWPDMPEYQATLELTSSASVRSECM